jgi:hypothetical protein
MNLVILSKSYTHRLTNWSTVEEAEKEQDHDHEPSSSDDERTVVLRDGMDDEDASMDD